MPAQLFFSLFVQLHLLLLGHHRMSSMVVFHVLLLTLVIDQPYIMYAIGICKHLSSSVVSHACCVAIYYWMSVYPCIMSMHRFMCYIIFFQYKVKLFLINKMFKLLIFLEYSILQNTICFSYFLEYSGNVLKIDQCSLFQTSSCIAKQDHR